MPVRDEMENGEDLPPLVVSHFYFHSNTSIHSANIFHSVKLIKPMCVLHITQTNIFSSVNSVPMAGEGKLPQLDHTFLTIVFKSSAHSTATTIMHI